MTTGQAARRGDILGLEGTTFDGRFRVDRFIAEGGYAVVYRAFQFALDRWVALKVLKAPRGGGDHALSEFRDTFAREAKTIAKLRHPHIVNVYDFSVAMLKSGDPAPWMALEWLDGETLAKRLQRRRAGGERGLAPAAAFDLLRSVLQALAHAHASSIVHRDVKPANIMVLDEPGGALKVLDFGIAKIMVANEVPSSGHTRTEGMPAFSPTYAAPEQVAFSRTGPWTDVHALGLVLCELMTDEPPFEDDGDAHVFEQVMARDRPTPARKGRDVGAFESVLAKAVALAPRDRWRNAGELLAALEEAKVGRTLTAGRSGDHDLPTASRTQRWGRGTRPRAIAATITAVGIAAGAGWFAAHRRAAEFGPLPSTTRSAWQTSVPALVATPTSVAPTGSSPGPVPEVTAATSATRPMAVAKRRRNKKAPIPAPITDGRDLFDDTK